MRNKPNEKHSFLVVHPKTILYLCYYILMIFVFLQLVYPLNSGLSEQDKINICYLAFPDSNSGCMGDTIFHIRFRLSPDKGSNSSILKLNHKLFNTQCLPVHKADISHYWGFVYFRQKRDPNLPRGYFQKVTLLSINI